VPRGKFFRRSVWFKRAIEKQPGSPECWLNLGNAYKELNNAATDRFQFDLFHKTGDIRFADGYENRRINVTLLHGVREKA
jgi:hypothetical protein